MTYKGGKNEIMPKIGGQHSIYYSRFNFWRCILSVLITIILFNCSKENDNGGPLKPIETVGERAPVFSPDGEFVAYGSYSLGGIWLFEIATEESEYLTGGGSPDWSPDGKEIVYGSGRNIYKINVETKESKQLTTEGFFPDWSPNNEYIVFSINAGDSAGLYIMDSSGNNMHSVGDWGWIEPDWHPQGSMLTFIGWIDNKGGVCIVDTNGDNAHLIFEGGDSPVFSPDGSKIAYVCESCTSYNIWVMDTNGNNKTQLTFEREASACWDPGWSPDGTQIVYVLAERIEKKDVIEYHYHLWIMDADGENKNQLTGKEAKTFGCK